MKYTNKLLGYFFGGLIFLVPVIIFYHIVKTTSTFVANFFPELNILLSFVIAVVSIALIGLTIKGLLGKSLRKIISKKSKKSGVIPNLFKLFVNYEDFSEKVKEVFKNPVYIETSEGVEQIGFITDKDVSFIGAADDRNKESKKIAVYAPQPISFMGPLFFADSSKIKVASPEQAKEISLYLFTAGIFKKF